MTEEEKVDPMVKMIREAIAQGGEVTITLRGKRFEDDEAAPMMSGIPGPAGPMGPPGTCTCKCASDD